MKAVKTKTLIVIALALYGFSSASLAVRVDDLYAAVVPLEGGAGSVREEFGVALAQVLVKATGRREIAADAAVVAQFGDASRFVQQYRIDSDNQVWVQFDEVAVRRELDRLREAVWGSERPTTLVWLIMDDGYGQRRILGGLPEGEQNPDLMPAGEPEDPSTGLLREELLAAAAARGLPLLLPLADTLEITSIPLSDVWGGFTESLVAASARYGPDAILVGRARTAGPGAASVRWTLLRDDRRFDWEGNVASGANDVADFFAARLATSVGSSSRIVLSVDAVDSLDAYGRVSAYLAELDLVEEIAVDRVRNDRVIYRLKIRGNTDQLMRSIALQRVLQPVDAALEGPGGDPTLHYRVMSARVPPAVETEITPLDAEADGQ